MKRLKCIADLTHEVKLTKEMKVRPIIQKFRECRKQKTGPGWFSYMQNMNTGTECQKEEGKNKRMMQLNGKQ